MTGSKIFTSTSISVCSHTNWTSTFYVYRFIFLLYIYLTITRIYLYNICKRGFIDFFFTSVFFCALFSECIIYLELLKRTSYCRCSCKRCEDRPKSDTAHAGSGGSSWTRVHRAHGVQYSQRLHRD